MEKILIAEDEAVAQKLMATIVKKMGHLAFVSPNGYHALDVLNCNNDFSLLITDIMMPEMDGRELIRNVRKHEHYKNLPIIIVSAFVGVKEISSFLETGATFFQPKPLKKASMEEHINRCLAMFHQQKTE